MSLASQTAGLATAVGTDVKDILLKMGALTSLTTANKASLVGAINEAMATAVAAAASGGATTLDGLTDVVVATPAVNHILWHNGTNFTNVVGTTKYDAVGSAAAAQAASQPLHANLTALAAVAATAYGRSVLTSANSAALTAMLTAATETTLGAVELATVAEAQAGTDTTRAVTPAGAAAVITQLIGAAPANLNSWAELVSEIQLNDSDIASIMTQLSNKQPIDATLTAIAAQVTAANKIIYSTGVDTFAVADFTAFGRSLVAAADAAAARTLLVTYSQTEIGSPTTDFVAAYTTAKA